MSNNAPPSIPAAVELETEVVATMMIHEHLIPVAQNLLSVRDFYSAKHRAIFEGLCTVYAQHQAADVALLQEHLQASGRWEVVGGFRTLSGLMDRIGTSANLERYARVIKERTLQRDMLSVAAEIQAHALDSGEITTEDRLRQVDALVRTLYQETGLTDMSEARQCAREHHEIVERARDHHGLVGHTTGLRSLDNCTGGLMPGWQVLVMAAAGVGKSALAINNLALSVARTGEPVAIFSLEMTRAEVIGRMIAAIGGVPYHVQTRGQMSEEDEASYVSAMGYVEQLPVWVDEGDMMTIEQLGIRARALQHRVGRPLGLIVVDYLQLLESGKKHGNRTEELATMSRSLKRLAKELGCPVVTLSQPTAEGARSDRPLRLSDARGSQSIGADVDLALLLNRNAEQGTIKLEGGKFRHGPTFAITEDELRWRGDLMMFVDRGM